MDGLPGREPGRSHAWTDAVDVALDQRHRIDAVLCAGDLFDHPSPNAELVAPVAEGAEALLGGGKSVIFLPGAYDGLTHPNGVYSTRAFPEGVLVVDWAEPRRVELPVGSNLLHLYTAAARPGRNGIEAAQFKRQDGEGRHVGLLHGVVGGPGPGDPPCLWGRRDLPESFFAGCDLDLFVLGGGHSYLAARHGRTLVVQPGATHGLDANGPGCRGFLVADLEVEGVQVAREGRPPVHPEISPVRARPARPPFAPGSIRKKPFWPDCARRTACSVTSCAAWSRGAPRRPGTRARRKPERSGSVSPPGGGWRPRMWIERLRMRDPNGVERSVRFGRGLGVILGGSESGKTRLASVLFETLFGPRVGCRPEGGPPVTGGAAWAEVTFHVGQRRFVLRRGFLRGSVLFVEERAEGGSTKKVWFKGTSSDPGHEAAWRRALHGLLGVSDGGVWADSGFVLQGDLTLRAGATGDTGVEGGGHAEAQEALAVLEAEHSALAGGAGSGRPGTLDETRAELEQRRGETAHWEERAAQLWSLEEERARLESERAQAERELAEQEEMLQNLKRFEELTQDRTRLEESLGQLRGEQNRIRKQVEAVEAGEARLEADFADFLDAPGDLEECVHAWSESATRLRDVEMDLARLEDAAASLPRSHARRTGLLAAAALGALVWLACLGADAKTVGIHSHPALRRRRVRRRLVSGSQRAENAAQAGAGSGPLECGA